MTKDNTPDPRTLAMQFRKKPVVIEAIQWTGDNLRDVIGFTGKHPRWSEWFSSWEDYEARVRKDGGIFKIITLEGNMEASIGDWIIRGVRGEHYPCKPDIFKATYEPAALRSSPSSSPSVIEAGDAMREELVKASTFMIKNAGPTETSFRIGKLVNAWDRARSEAYAPEDRNGDEGVPGSEQPVAPTLQSSAADGERISAHVADANNPSTR